MLPHIFAGYMYICMYDPVTWSDILTYDGEGDEPVQGGVPGPGHLALVLTRVPGPGVPDHQGELWPAATDQRLVAGVQGVGDVVHGQQLRDRGGVTEPGDLQHGVYKD